MPWFKLCEEGREREGGREGEGGRWVRSEREESEKEGSGTKRGAWWELYGGGS
jgi:hypothetical protein